MAKKKIVFLVLGIVGFLILFVPGFSKLQDLIERNRKLTLHLEELEETNARLREELELLKNDPFYREKVAREELGVIKEGETIYRIVPPDE